MSGEAHLHAGDRVANRFLLQAPIGSGGSGAVWRALDEHLHRVVALKVLRHSSADDERRLRREARALAALQHPHIVGVYDVVDGPPAVLVLEYVAGRTLRTLLDERLLRVDEVKALARALVAALEAAHRAGVVHGDVKPDNVIVDDMLQRICLIDFGLAAPIADAGVVDATRTLSIRGTPSYLAPEAIEAPNTDGTDGSAADRYAVGVVLLECLVGDNVFRGPTTAQTLARHAERVPPDPRFSRAPGEVDDAFANVVTALLSKDPIHRPSWSTVLASLESSTPSTQPTSTRPTSTRPTSAQPTSAQPTSAQPTSTLPTSTQPTSTQPTSAQPREASAGRARPWWVVAGVSAVVVVAATGIFVVKDGSSSARLSGPAPLDPVVPLPAVEPPKPKRPPAQQNPPPSTNAPTGSPNAGRSRDVRVVHSGAPQRQAVAPAPASPAEPTVSQPPPPAGLPGKRAWVHANCAVAACVSLASAAVPDDLVELQRYRADIDACIQQCLKP